MTTLSGDAFVKALNSETVNLLVGPHQEPIVVSKALLSHKSEYFALHLAKQGLTELPLPGIGVSVSKIFVCWCYQERLQTLPAKSNPNEKKEWKELLIDLYLFADIYGIPKLQNQVIEQLVGLFKEPSILTKQDIEYIWSRNSTSHCLRDLAVMTLVAQIELSNGDSKFAEYEDLAKLEGFTGLVYENLSVWKDFQVKPKQEGKKWALLLEDASVKEALRVVEKAVKVPKKKEVRPFLPGEVIEID